MDSVSRANGGIFEAERRLQQTLAEDARLRVQVFGLRDEFAFEDSKAWLPLVPKVFPIVGPPGFGYSRGLRRAVLAADADVAYCAGIWKYHSLLSLQWARRTRKPLVVAPHGMLDDWAVKQSRRRKRLAGLLYQNAQLETAGCIRALCDAEARAIRKYGVRKPICIIPNGVDLPAADGDLESHTDNSPMRRFAAGRKILLYLGRIHPKKGLDNLLRAWYSIFRERGSLGRDWVLVIAGWGQQEDEAQLRKLAGEMALRYEDLAKPGVEHLQSGISDTEAVSVLLLGPQFGDAKAEAFRDCDAFVLPSLSEGLPMVVLEAWARRKPVLLTPACNLPEAFVDKAAIQIEPDAASIATGLRQMFEMSASELSSIGVAGHRLAASRYAWPRVAAQMKTLIEWLLDRAPRPDFLVDY
jgi:poly(glycerol-phosphate) alpha-glucosyltransferase